MAAVDNTRMDTIESISGHIGDASPTKTGAATVSTDERIITKLRLVMPLIKT